MRRSAIIVRAGKSLRRARARTILTSLAIAVGATTICLAMAAGNGGRALVSDMVRDRGDEQMITVLKVPQEVPQESSAPRGPIRLGVEEVEEEEEEEAPGIPAAARIYFTEEEKEQIANVPGVAGVMQSVWVIARSVDGVEGRYQASVETQVNRQNVDFVSGVEKDYRLAAGEVAVGEWYLGALGMTVENAIGQSVTLNFLADIGNWSNDDPETFAREFTIVAVISRNDRRFSEAFLISLDDGEEISEAQGAGRYGSQLVLVEVADGHDPTRVRDAIQALSADYNVWAMSDVHEELFTAVNIAQWGLMGFGGLALLASVFGIINTQYISVLERTRQIGLMKALGMRRRDIARLFRYEAAWIGFLGGAIGVFVAFLVSLANPLIAEFLNLDDGVRVLQINPLEVLGLVVGLMVIAVLAGYFPARKAAKLDPIEALRTE